MSSLVFIGLRYHTRQGVSLESGWGDEALEFPLEQAREVYACMVAVLGTDDLDAYG